MILLRTLLNLRNAKLSIKYHLVLFSLQGILFFATTMEGSPVCPTGGLRVTETLQTPSAGAARSQPGSWTSFSVLSTSESLVHL